MRNTKKLTNAGTVQILPNILRHNRCFTYYGFHEKFQEGRVPSNKRFKLTKADGNYMNAAAINTGTITTTSKFIALWGGSETFKQTGR